MLESTYVTFTKVCDKQIAKHGRTRNAILEAIRLCNDRDILKEYLESKKKEVVNIMMVLYDEQEIMRSYVESERHDARVENSIRTAKRLLEKGEMLIEDIAECTVLPIKEVRNLERN